MANSGYKGYATLEEYWTDNGAATGVTKANTEGQADYIAPIYDPTACSALNISLNPYGATISYVAQISQFFITSNYPSYTFASDSSWAMVTGGSGGNQTVTVRAVKNLGGLREASIRVIYAGATIAFFSLTQDSEIPT